MNKNLLMPLLGIIILPLSSCAIEKHTDQHTICSQLKREIIFYQHDNNMNPQWSSTTKRAQLMQEYKKYQCE
jgi:hypothetical protein